MPRAPILSILVCVLALLPVAGMPGRAAEQPCAAQVDQALTDLQIDPAERRSISMEPIIKTRKDGGSVVGYEAWVRLNACDGALIVELNRQCRVRQSYTRGDCQVEGLKSY